MPQAPNDWMKIASEFEKKLNFPHCVGSVDGKHIQIQAPINNGSNFFNYKSTFSILLFAIVDSHYNFIFADIGYEGAEYLTVVYLEIHNFSNNLKKIHCNYHQQIT